MSRPFGSTYRLQLNGFGFRRARQAVDYLHRLGVETLYVSPIMEAVLGSTHGYDVIDPTRLDPALGTDADLEALVTELDAHGMRLLIDTVPNHLAATSSNPWWWETLRLGRDAPHARVFDIDWSEQEERVLLPVLGRPIGEVLDAGELQVDFAGEEPVLAYFDARFPLDPTTTANLPNPGDRVGMARLLQSQHYRLAHWRLGRRQINYRRFFDVDGLVGVRVEDPEVYQWTHRKILELVADHRVAGLRLDHIDGLADPAAYLDRLRADVDRVRADAGLPEDVAVLVVEKIVSRSECIPADWPVGGMTGYEFADLVGGLWIEPSAGDPTFAERATSAKREVLAVLFAGQVAWLARAIAVVVESAAPGVELDPDDVAPAVMALTARLGVYRTYLGGRSGEEPSHADRRQLSRAATLALGDLDAEGRRALGHFVDGLLDSSKDRRWSEVARRWQQLTGAVAAKGVEDTALYRTEGSPAAAEVGRDPGDPAITPDDFHWGMQGRAVLTPGGLNATSSHDTKRSEDVRWRLAVLSEWADEWEAQMSRWEARHRELVGADRLPARHDLRRIYASAVGMWPAAGVEGGTTIALAERLRQYAVKAAREAKVRTSWLEPADEYEELLERFIDRLLGAHAAGRFGVEVTRVVGVIGPAAAVNGLAALVVKATAPGVPDFYQGTEVWSDSLVDPDNRRPVDFEGLDAMLTRLDHEETSLAELLTVWQDGRVKMEVTRRLLRLRRNHPELFASSDYVPLVVSGPRSEHVLAFARRQGTQLSVTVVPRLVLGLAGPGSFPIGPDLWAGTSVELPTGTGGNGSRLVDELTGSVVPTPSGVLQVGQALGEFPVAVLLSAESAESPESPESPE